MTDTMNAENLTSTTPTQEPPKQTMESRLKALRAHYSRRSSGAIEMIKELDGDAAASFVKMTLSLTCYDCGTAQESEGKADEFSSVLDYLLEDVADQGWAIVGDEPVCRKCLQRHLLEVTSREFVANILTAITEDESFFSKLAAALLTGFAERFEDIDHEKTLEAAKTFGGEVTRRHLVAHIVRALIDAAERRGDGTPESSL
jgi:hypothetical protein